MSSFCSGVRASSSSTAGEGVGCGRAIARRSGGSYIKLAGSRLRGAGTVALALALAGLVPAPAQAAELAEDVIRVPAGAYFREDMLAPPDGSAWHGTVVVLNHTGRIDAYVLRTTDLLGAYPSGGFEPVERVENVTYASIDFFLPGGFSFSLVVDNLDNSRAADAAPAGEVEVKLVRTPPLRASAGAQAALGAGAGICAVVLAAAAVAAAVYLKRRPRRDTDEDLASRVPRIEIPVEVPKPPKGSWARQDGPEPEPPKGGR